MVVGYDVSIVEFAYDNLINRSTGKTPFQIVHGRSPKGVMDLVSLSTAEHEKSVDVETFAEYMRDIHE
jgi:hypothetical protein